MASAPAEADFVPVRPHLNLPNFRFVFPHAPVRPVTLNRGMRMRAWYDIHYLERGPDRESLSDAVDSERQIVELIDREAVSRNTLQSECAGWFQSGVCHGAAHWSSLSQA